MNNPIEGQPTIEQLEANANYILARIDAEQPRPDPRLFTELGRLAYLKLRLEQKS